MNLNAGPTADLTFDIGDVVVIKEIEDHYWFKAEGHRLAINFSEVILASNNNHIKGDL